MRFAIAVLCLGFALPARAGLEGSVEVGVSQAVNAVVNERVPAGVLGLGWSFGRHLFLIEGRALGHRPGVGPSTTVAVGWRGTLPAQILDLEPSLQLSLMPAKVLEIGASGGSHRGTALFAAGVGLTGDLGWFSIGPFLETAFFIDDPSGLPAYMRAGIRLGVARPRTETRSMSGGASPWKLELAGTLQGPAVVGRFGSSASIAIGAAGTVSIGTIRTYGFGARVHIVGAEQMGGTPVSDGGLTGPGLSAWVSLPETEAGLRVFAEGGVMFPPRCGGGDDCGPAPEPAVGAGLQVPIGHVDSVTFLVGLEVLAQYGFVPESLYLRGGPTLGVAFRL